MTCGDRYIELTERFIEIQDEFISVTCNSQVAADLSQLMIELRMVQQELNDLQAFMKLHRLSLVDDYPLESAFQYLNPQMKKAS